MDSDDIAFFQKALYAAADSGDATFIYEVISMISAHQQMKAGHGAYTALRIVIESKIKEVSASNKTTFRPPPIDTEILAERTRPEGRKDSGNMTSIGKMLKKSAEDHHKKRGLKS